MRFGIQHRRVCLLPPSEDDLAWVATALDREEIWRAFGYDGPAGAELWARRREVDVGVVRRVDRAARVGFTVVFPPCAELPVPELAYAIPRRVDRDAFTAIAAADALSHYVFDHLGFPEVGFRTRTSNLAARAVLRRLGYRPEGQRRIRGRLYLLHRLDRARWSERRRRLEHAERVRPSGLGEAFRALPAPPFAPVRAALTSGGQPSLR
jgi:hypothetical protein